MSEIILADRDKEVVELLTEMFTLYGFTCLAFPRASTLLWDAISKSKHTYCILDIHFIGALLRKDSEKELYLEKFEKLKPIVFVTGAREPTPDEIKFMFRLKASFFEKPLIPFSLLEFADKALQIG